MPDAQRRQLRLLSLITAAVVAVFAFSGVSRHEGLAFNQRYHLELLPLLAVGFAWSLDRIGSPERPFWAGVLCGMVPAVLLLDVMSPGTSRTLLLLRFPLVMAAALAGLWFLALRGHTRLLLTGMAGVCLGWGLSLHLGDDMAASRTMRSWNHQTTERLRAVVPDHSVLMTYWGSRDAAGPLLFDRDVVILDAHADDGRDAPRLIGELLARRRRVFVLRDGFPQDVLSRVVAGWIVVPVPGRPGTDLAELRAAPAEESRP